MKIGLGTVIGWLAQPVAWAIWFASFKRYDLRDCNGCRARKAELNRRFPDLFR